MTITQPHDQRPQQPRLTAGLLFALGLLAATAPLATDLYLPAFPEMVGDLGTSTIGVQLSLTAFLVGAALGQVTFGPLSDRVGRLRPLLVGTTIYLGAGVAAALAPSAALLVLARLLQGMSGASGMVIGRAVISDLTQGREAARVFSLMMLVGGVAPVVAPIAGSLLAAPLGWRGLLWIVAAMGGLALIVTRLAVPESLPRSLRVVGRESADRPGIRALFERRFAGNAIAFAFAFATMMAYISASPFLYQDLLGMTQWQYGLAFGLNALALTFTGGISARMTRRHHPVGLARTGLLANFAAAVAMVIIVAAGLPASWLLVPILVAVAALGFVLGNVTALALAPVAKASGMGSAAIGLLQFGLAGAVAPLVSIDGTSTAMPLAITMLACSTIANLAFTLAGHARADQQVPALEVSLD